MSQTTTPSGAELDLLATLDATAREFRYAGEYEDEAGIKEIRTAVAAMIARNAELEAERNELERLCDATYVQQGADAYHHACEVLEAWQEARFVAGKDRGCEGSLCDGLSWLQSQVTKLEDDRDALAAENKALRDVVEATLEACEADIIANTGHEDAVGVLEDAAREALARTPAKENDDA